MTVRTARRHMSTVDFPDDVQRSGCTQLTMSRLEPTPHGAVRREITIPLSGPAWECLDYNASDPLIDRCDECGEERRLHP